MYHFWSIKISHDTNQVLQDLTPQSTAQLLHKIHMMSHTCITCPLSFLDWVHVTSFSQLSCLPSPLLGQLGSLSSPLSNYFVLGACYVIQLLDLLPSSVQYCACISVNLSQSTRLVVASCWSTKRIQFTWTFTCTFKCTFILIIIITITKLSNLIGYQLP